MELSSVEDRVNHLMDTVVISKFLLTIIEESGLKILYDALEKCADGNIPFMKAMVESESTMFHHEMGMWYSSQCQDPPGELGDRVTHIRDLIEFRFFMKNLILNSGVETVERFMEYQCPLVKELFDLEKNSFYLEHHMYDRIMINKNGKRVAALPIEAIDTRSGVVIIEPSSCYPTLEKVAKQMKVVDYVDLVDDN